MVKTSEAIYVDGSEIGAYIMNGKLKLEDEFFEVTPGLLGSPEPDSIRWLSKLGETI